MNINELKLVVAEMLEEAKKKKEKEIKAKENSGGAKNAYGTYAEALDFSWPLGAHNLYRSQGAVNWGPETNAGTHVDQNFANPNTFLGMNEERALRHIVREVIEYGLVPANSAWAPMMESSRSADGGSLWEEALRECDHWYMQHTETNGMPEAGPKKRTSVDKTKYGKVAKHGPPESKGGARKKAW
jgi:hypothetical protein